MTQAKSDGEIAVTRQVERLASSLDEKLRNLGVALIDQRVLNGSIAAPIRTGAEKAPVVSREELVVYGEGPLVRVPTLLRKTMFYAFGNQPGEPVASVGLTGAYYIWPDRTEYVQIITIRSLTTPRQSEKEQRQIAAAPLPPTQAQLSLFREILKQTGFTPTALDECLKNGSHTVPPPKAIRMKPPTQEELVEEANRKPYAGPVESCRYGPTEPLTGRFQSRLETTRSN